MTEELAALRREFGLSLVIELTCRGMGRDVAGMARIAADASVAVVAATGWYYEPFHPEELSRTSAEQPARRFLTGRDGPAPAADGRPADGPAQPAGPPR
ncbi:hypothetical protein ACIGW8_05880 [Streptomyces sioyaensis]|uniref:phosphotriesterase family protein n=1 Tax=Streptomyces sioyaensis TaxID=67364 RepID=UPI0037CE9598